jgi:hypothetical protein
LHPIFEMLVALDAAYAASVNAFDQLFALAERLVEKVDDWVQEMAAALPTEADQQHVLIVRSLLAGLKPRPEAGGVDRAPRPSPAGQASTTWSGMCVPWAYPSRSSFTTASWLSTTRTRNQLLQTLKEDLFVGGLAGDRFRSEGKEPM